MKRSTDIKLCSSQTFNWISLALRDETQKTFVWIVAHHCIAELTQPWPKNSNTYLKSASRINSGVCMIIVWMNGMVRAHEFRRYSRSSTTQLPSCCLNSVFFVFRARCSRRDLWVMSSHFRCENRKTETW